MDKKLLNEVKYVIKGVAIFDVILITILLATSKFSIPMLLGIIFGSIIAVLNFRLLAISIEKAVTMPANKAQLYSSSNYTVRMMITGVVLIVSAKVSHLNVIGVALGLLSPQFVILSKTLLINKLKRKEA
ncbi:MAG: ATP synthase subunit I [Clostridium sp.]